jgi:long-chain acyl-CoA synthetase
VPVSGGPRPAPGTLTQLFFEAIERFDKPDALVFKAHGKWERISSRQVAERARRVALGLQALGVRRGDRIGLLSENRPEWAIADYGCLTGGLSAVPIYPTLPAEQIPHILKDSGAVACFVSNDAQAAKVAEVRSQVPSLRHVISFASPLPAGADLTFDELLARGQADESAETIAAWKRDALTAKPGDLATLIYTSGTTGVPKGVMLTHDNLYSNATAVRNIIPFTGNDVELSFLPLSHVFQRLFDYLAWYTGTTIAYAESIDAVAANMLEVRPTIMCAVPRLYEKIYARVLENALRGGAIKRAIFTWATKVADRVADVRLAGGTPGGMLAWQHGIADKLVFSKIRARTGGRMRYFVSGGAPLAPQINKFFYAAGLTILEGYGLTETSPVIAVNTPDRLRIGTVGPLAAGVEVEIAEDGEILTRGPHVMQGYFNNPSATREAIDDQGWFHTGDIGTIDDGFLRITDRKKDLIKTSGGKYIAPQPIENKVKLSKFVAEAVLIAEGRKFPSMLIVPNFETLQRWAAANRITETDRGALVRTPAVQAKMEAEAALAFQGLASFETPKKIALLEHEFSIERGELTPKMSVKRRVIDRNYKAVIDALYTDQRPS